MQHVLERPCHFTCVTVEEYISTVASTEHCREGRRKRLNAIKGRFSFGNSDYSRGNLEWVGIFCSETSLVLGLCILNSFQASMDEMGMAKTGKHIQRKESDECWSQSGPGIPRFITQLHERIQKSLKSHLKRSVKDDEVKSANSVLRKEKGSLTAYEVNLEKQLQAWKENPTWTDKSPETKVTVPKGSLCNLNVKVDVGLPPDAVYNIVTDPDNKRVFKNIKEVISRTVLVDEGLRQVVELEQAALWRFLWWSGTFSVHVLVDQNREDHTMKFKQLKTGFMKRFEGCWRVAPLLVDAESCHPFIPTTMADYVTCAGGKGRVGSKVSLEQIIQPAIVPPPPISWYLRGITAKTTEMLISDLLAEAARIRGDSDAKTSAAISDECQADQILDIKQRWSLHRKNTKHSHRRLPLLVKSPTID